MRKISSKNLTMLAKGISGLALSLLVILCVKASPEFFIVGVTALMVIYGDRYFSKELKMVENFVKEKAKFDTSEDVVVEKKESSGPQE